MSRLSQWKMSKDTQRMHIRTPAAKLSTRRRYVGDSLRGFYKRQMYTRDVQVFPSARASSKPAEKAKVGKQRRGSQGRSDRCRVGKRNARHQPESAAFATTLLRVQSNAGISPAAAFEHGLSASQPPAKQWHIAIFPTIPHHIAK